MEQLLLLPAWPDDMNLLSPGLRFYAWPSPPALWQALWVEFRSPDDAYEKSKWDRRGLKRPGCAGEWIAQRAAGRYICYRRLPNGPLFKLSEWEQLDPGRAILWHPEPSDDDIEFAKVRAGYLRRLGRGHFDVQARPNGTLWIKRLA